MNRDYKSFFGGSAAALGGVVVIGGCNYLTRRILAGSLSLDHYGFFYGMFSFVVFCGFRRPARDYGGDGLPPAAGDGGK